MRTRSCIERITVSTFQTLYQEGLLSSGKTTLASLINIKNACMNAWRLWIVDCLNVCMYECMKTLNCWLLECMHIWMNENFKFLIVWMYACMYEWICVLDCVKILIDFSLSFFYKSNAFQQSLNLLSQKNFLFQQSLANLKPGKWI